MSVFSFRADAALCFSVFYQKNMTGVLYGAGQGCSFSFDRLLECVSEMPEAQLAGNFVAVTASLAALAHINRM